jgi:hypothetical protein
MRGRRPLLVMLGGGLLFLASLYLSWREPSGRSSIFVAGNFDGWSTQAGVAASLVALVLLAGAAATLVRFGVLDRLPFAPLAFLLPYLAIGGLVYMRAEEKLFPGHQRYHYAYGAYLGVGAAAVTLLASVAHGRGTIVRRPTAVEALAVLLGVGLLISFLLPWAHTLGPGNASFPGVTLPVVVLAAAGLCLLAHPALRSGRQLYGAAAIAILTVAGVNAVRPDKVGYGAWMAVGFAVALVALVAFRRWETRPALPSAPGALIAAAATAFVVSLFLPWKEFCSSSGRPLGHGLGRCIVTTGWAGAEPGTVAGVLALVLALAAVVATAASIAELALTVAILTATVGIATLDLPPSVGFHLGLGYGAYVGFAAAGVLFFVAFAGVRLPRFESGRMIDRLVPLAAVLACFCAVAFPLWSVLPERWGPEVNVLQGWYAVAGLLITIHLVRRWVESAGGDSLGAEELVYLPLVLLALTALELVRERDLGMTWGGGILVGLCLVLALFGWIEQRGGLERLEVPEVLRVDRLPETEG